MSQFNFPTIDPLVTTGSELADYLNGWVPAVESSHAGAARPAYIGAGGLWVEQVSATEWNLMLYTGGGDAKIGTINPTTGVVASSPPFPAGTRMLFQQTTPPPGWTKDTGVALDDVGLRVTTGSVTDGGATAFTSVFGTGKNTGGYALTTADIPAHLHAVSITTGINSVDHTHSTPNHTHTINDPGHFHQAYFQASGFAPVPGGGNNNTALGNTGSKTTGITITSSGGGTSGNNSVDHTHAVSGNTANAGGGGSHLHSLSLNLKYTSVIVAIKD